jgi:dipeptidyl aminopeptidase/acylaminoacyl peptidase
MIGKTLGNFQISSLLGRGGMGEVYRAKDQKLGRDVAIKVLPEEFAKDADRVARFQWEAKLLASLNHPNIAAIHGLEESHGTHIAFSKSPNINLHWIPTDGSGAAQPLLEKEEGVQLPSSCSPNGRILAFYEINADTKRDIWEIPIGGDGAPKPILNTKYSEHSAMFSPDGHWLAYVSDETGQEEIYVRLYPGSGGKHAVSSGGGREPVWSSGGREIFYRNGDKMMVAAVQTEPEFTARTPRVLFEEPYAMWFGGGNNYDVTSDGQRLLMIRRDLESAIRQIHVVLNWFEELKERIPMP